MNPKIGLKLEGNSVEEIWKCVMSLRYTSDRLQLSPRCNNVIHQDLGDGIEAADNAKSRCVLRTGEQE
jgi:hypothetical protein